MSVFNRDLVVQLLNKLLSKADLTIGKTDEVLGDTKKILTAVNGGTGVVKSVQRGRCSFYEAPQNDEYIYYREIKISPINPQKSMVLINGTLGSTHIQTVFLVDLASDRICLGHKLIGSAMQSDTIKNVSWQVIEFY